MTDTLIAILLLVPTMVVAIVFHEVAHGWAALALGDPTAQEQRRLSFNPIRHVDLFGTLLLPGALALAGMPVFGWAKPVPVNKARLANPRFGMMAVAAAGPGMNFALALVGAVVLGLAFRVIGGVDQQWHQLLLAGLFSFIGINLFLALFNLLPLPPFDGSHIVEGLLPPSLAGLYARARPYGMLLIILLLVVLPWATDLLGLPQLRLIERIVVPPMEYVQGFYLELAGWIAGE